MKIMKKILLGVLVTVLLLVAFMFYNTLTYGIKPPRLAPTKKIAIADDTIQRFQQALQINTVNLDIQKKHSGTVSTVGFENFQKFIASNYPLVESKLSKQVFHTYTYLYKWQGSKPDLAPIVLSAHYDTVDVNAERWKSDPFAAEIIDNQIYARGAIDMKNVVVAYLESINLLLSENYQPQRTIYLALNHDEESSYTPETIGAEVQQRGAAAVAEYLNSQKVQPLFVLEEGGLFRLAPSGLGSAALITVTEKGFAVLTLKAKYESSRHTSTPPKQTAIGILATAISKLENYNFKSEINLAFKEYLKTVSNNLTFKQKFFLANLFIFEPMVTKSMSDNDLANNALVKSITITPTIFNSGNTINVVPIEAEAGLVLKVNAGYTVDMAVTLIKKIINDDKVEVIIEEYQDPSPISSTSTEGYTILRDSIYKNYSGVLVAPFISLARTDGSTYSKYFKNVYGFNPFTLGKDNATIFHGDNERIPIDEYKNQIRFYVQLIKNSN